MRTVPAVDASYLIGDENGYCAVSENDVAPGAYTFSSSFEELSHVSTGVGESPCNIYRDGGYNLVYTANYGSGTISVLKLDGRGRIRKVAATLRFQGNGPAGEQQRHPRIHQIFDYGDGWLLASDLGADCIRILKKNARTGVPKHVGDFKLPSGCGPRIMTSDAGRRLIYLVTEISREVFVLRPDRSGDILSLEMVQRIKCDDSGACGGGADIQIHPSGKWLYASMRLSHEGIARFSVNSDGTLEYQDYTPTGSHPRSFAVTPDGGSLIVACMYSGCVQVFAIDGQGRLMPTNSILELDPDQPSSVHVMPVGQHLYVDPVFCGAADPTVCYNPVTGTYYMYYTSRRANVQGLGDIEYAHGTAIGIAESRDGRAGWKYTGDADIDYHPDSDPSFWAPEVIYAGDRFHMFLTYVPGTFNDWEHPRDIVHLTSEDGRSWQTESVLELASKNVIDACVARLPDGKWRLWYNNEAAAKTIWYADSDDLYNWTDRGRVTSVNTVGKVPMCLPSRGRIICSWTNGRGFRCSAAMILICGGSRTGVIWPTDVKVRLWPAMRMWWWPVTGHICSSSALFPKAAGRLRCTSWSSGSTMTGISVVAIRIQQKQSVFGRYFTVSVQYKFSRNNRKIRFMGAE